MSGEQRLIHPSLGDVPSGDGVADIPHSFILCVVDVSVVRVGMIVLQTGAA